MNVKIGDKVNYRIGTPGSVIGIVQGVYSGADPPVLDIYEKNNGVGHDLVPHMNSAIGAVSGYWYELPGDPERPGGQYDKPVKAERKTAEEIAAEVDKKRDREVFYCPSCQRKFYYRSSDGSPLHTHVCPECKAAEKPKTYSGRKKRTGKLYAEPLPHTLTFDVPAKVVQLTEQVSELQSKLGSVVSTVDFLKGKVEGLENGFEGLPYGPPGPAGPAGPQGPKGDPGEPGAVVRVHNIPDDEIREMTKPKMPPDGTIR